MFRRINPRQNFDQRVRFLLSGLFMLVLSQSACAESFPNVGRPATAKEIASWDIDVRPDFKGLPAGSGTVIRGQQVWDEKCASCHGSFGELNEVFTPIVGGTSKDDMKTGRVAALADNKQPQRTTLMKVSTLSTLWDYINRAMPWTAPKTLTTEEVYAVTAYILFLGEIIPEEFTLSDKNMPEVQALMPNRNGMTVDHGLRSILGKPDIKSTSCMKGCANEVKIHSSLPDVSRNAHGNLQVQNRSFGAVRGVDTMRPAQNQPLGDGRRSTTTLTVAMTDTSESSNNDPAALAKKYACLSCHGVTAKIVGPAFTDVASRYKGKAAAEKQLIERVRQGGSGNWGNTPMPSQAGPSETELVAMVRWILLGAK